MRDYFAAFRYRSFSATPFSSSDRKAVPWFEGPRTMNRRSDRRHVLAHGALIRKEMRVGVSVITRCSYYNSPVYYARTVADSGRRDMLFSSGDSSPALSSILSGEGFDEGV
jgi:hypothetical protein